MIKRGALLKVVIIATIFMCSCSHPQVKEGVEYKVIGKNIKWNISSCGWNCTSFRPVYILEVERKDKKYSVYVEKEVYDSQVVGDLVEIKYKE